MKKLNKLQISINLLSVLAGLYVMWQAVRFCYGEVSIPWMIKPEDQSPLWFIGIMFYYLGGITLWISAGILIMKTGQVAERVVSVGWRQFFKEEKENAARAEIAATREVGALIAVSVENGGILNSATSMIETTDGFYRVFGKVDVAAKGEQVIIRKEDRGAFSFEMLRLAGKDYPLTRLSR